MKIAFALGFLFRSSLVVSVSGLVACSSVLQASRLSRSFPQQPVETMGGVATKSVPEQASVLDEAQRLDAEAIDHSPHAMASGYRWIFRMKEGSWNTPDLGNWVVKPNR